MNVTKKFKKNWSHMKLISCHKNSIDTIDIDNEKLLFVTGSSDTTLKLWNLTNKNPLSVFAGHRDKVCKASFHHKYPILFSGSNDLFIKCWDLEYNINNRNYSGHFGPITSISYHPTMDILYSGSTDNTIRIWDMRTEKAIRIINYHTKEITSLIGNCESPHLISSSLDKKILFYDFISGKKIAQIKNRTEFRGLFDFNGKFFFVGVGEKSIYFIRKDGAIIHKQNNLTQNIKHYAFKKAGEFSICNDNDVIKTYDVKKINRCIELSVDSELIENKLTSTTSSLIYDKVKGDLILGKENGFISILKKSWQPWKPR
jgi:WD40 repeat protein